MASRNETETQDKDLNKCLPQILSRFIVLLIYTHHYELMKESGISGNWSLPFMMKVMVLNTLLVTLTRL
jgi:hypothetical protein